MKNLRKKDGHTISSPTYAALQSRLKICEISAKTHANTLTLCVFMRVYFNNKKIKYMKRIERIWFGEVQCVCVCVGGERMTDKG